MGVEATPTPLTSLVNKGILSVFLTFLVGVDEKFFVGKNLELKCVTGVFLFSSKVFFLLNYLDYSGKWYKFANRSFTNLITIEDYAAD